MKITRIECKFLSVSVTEPVTEHPHIANSLLVIVETDNGLRGLGMAREHEKFCAAVRHQIEANITPFIMDKDLLAPEQIWNEAAWDLSRGDYRVPSGAVSRAISAVDQALWDIRGHHYKQPVYKLLGGSKDEVDIYATFGLNTYTPEEEAEAARRVQAQGFTAFKLQGKSGGYAGSSADPNRGSDIHHDVARMKRLREIVGDKAKIILDGRNGYTLYDAKEVAKRIEPYMPAYFDEPMVAKDPQSMVELRRACPRVPVAARGFGGSIWTNRDLIAQGAIDIMGQSVMDGGGFTTTMKIAHMAEMYQLPLATGGGWHLQNSHVIAAANNGWMTEYHAITALVGASIYTDPPEPVNGRFRMSDKPGLGLELNEDGMRDAEERGRAAQNRK